MNRKQVVLLLLLGLLATLVTWIALRNRQPPLLPRDEIHRTAAGSEACLACHNADGPVPRSKNHPMGQDCFRCHGVRG